MAVSTSTTSTRCTFTGTTAFARAANTTASNTWAAGTMDYSTGAASKTAINTMTAITWRPSPVHQTEAAYRYIRKNLCPRLWGTPIPVNREKDHKHCDRGATGIWETGPRVVIGQTPDEARWLHKRGSKSAHARLMARWRRRRTEGHKSVQTEAILY